MGRTTSPGKQVLKDACVERKLPSTGSIRQLFYRLERFDEKLKLQKHSTSSSKIAKANTYFLVKSMHDAKKSIGKVKKNDKKLKKLPCISTPDKPLRMSAQIYVQTHCKNDVCKAPPEYVYGSDGKTVKLRVPKVCGSKSGQLVRWVNSK